MAHDTQHAWSFLHETDLARKLSKLGLVLNRPEPALICTRCKYALQPNGIRVSRHLAEKHCTPAADRRELVTYVDSLRLPDPNLLQGRKDGSEPHPHLAISKGAACSHCDFLSKSDKLVQRHLTKNHASTGYRLDWLQNGIRRHVSIQSWTQNGSRGYWTVDTKPEEVVHDSENGTGKSPRRLKRVQALYDEERRRMQKSNERYGMIDTGSYDEAVLGNWMRRTDWASVYSGVNRRLLVRLAEAPSADGSPLRYGEFEGQHLQSSAEDERRIRSIGAAIDAFFDKCEDTVRYTDHSIRCWLRSTLSDRPYKAPFQLPGRTNTRSRYRALWRRLLYFWFRLYRLEPTVRQTILHCRLTKEHKTVLDNVWRDPCWNGTPPGPCSGTNLDEEAAMRPPTRCSSMTSMSSWSAGSIDSMLRAGDSRSSTHAASDAFAEQTAKTAAGPERANSESVEDGGSIDLGLYDWPVDNDSDCSLGASSSAGIELGGEGKRATGVRSQRHRESADALVSGQMADIIGDLSFSMCCEEFTDGRSSTTMLVYFCGVLGISPDGSTFERPRNYTPKLSAMIHSARLICLEATLPRYPHAHIGWEARPRTGQLTKLNHLRTKSMCLGCQAPLGELLSLRSYGRAFSRTDGSSFRVRWSDDAQTVSWANGSLDLSDFRSFGQRSIESAETLIDRMMYGLRPKCDLNSIHDDMSVVKHGYSFVQDSRNDLATKYFDLSSLACLDSKKGLMSGESWNVKAVRRYLNQDHEVLKQLGLVLHLTGGQAPRSTELFSIECENGPTTSRGLYVYDGALCYVTRHSKSRRTTNQEFQVARYLPPCASQIFVRYLVYVRPFVAMLRRICFGQSEGSRLLFHHSHRSDASWKADILTQALKTHTRKICGIEIGIRVYRQLSIAFTEKHVKQISRPFHLNDDRSAQADMEVAFAWQSGHRPNQRGTSYGIDGAFPDSLQPALLRVYRWTSDQWHRFINLENPMRSERTTQAPLAWSRKNTAFGTEQLKRKGAPFDEETVDRPPKRRFPWDRPGELSPGRCPGPDRRRDHNERIRLRGSCASALRYLRSLPRTVLSAVREVHIEKRLLMADDDDNRSYVNDLWTHLIGSPTLRCVSIVVPDDMIVSAKKDQGQYEWFMWKLHKYSAQAFLDHRLDELRFIHDGEHADEGFSIYEWFNVENYIEKMLMPDNKVLFEIRSTYWREYYSSVDCAQDMRVLRRERAREAALRDIDVEWRQAGLRIRVEKDSSQGSGPTLVVNRLEFRS